MKPDFAQAQMTLAAVIGLRIMPEIAEGSYAGGDAGMVAASLALMAQQVDDAADLLSRENNAMRSLFRDAALDFAGMTSELQKAGLTRDDDLKLSTLSANHAAFSSLLIRLHAEVEKAGEPADAINARIWELLASGAAARSLAMPVM